MTSAYISLLQRAIADTWIDLYMQNNFKYLGVFVCLFFFALLKKKKELCSSQFLADTMFFKAMSKKCSFTSQLGLLLETEAPPFPSSSLLVSFFQISLLVQRGFIILSLVQLLLVKRNSSSFVYFYTDSFQLDQGVLVLTLQMQLTASCNSIFKSFIKQYPNLSFMSCFC